MKRLEERRVLNADAVPVDQLVIDAGSDGGDGQADTFHIEQDADHVWVSVNGQEVANASLAQINGITIRGSLDDDILLAEFKGGEPLAGLELLFDGGDGGNDSLTLADGAPVDEVNYSFGEGGENRIDILSADGLSTISYRGIEAVQDQLTAQERNFRFGEGAQDITLNDSGTSDDDLTRIVVKDIDDLNNELVVSFKNPLDALGIETSNNGNQADAVTLSGVDDRFDADLRMTGAENDVLSIQGPLDIGRGNVDIVTGTIRIEDSLVTSGANVSLIANDEIFVGAAGVVRNDAGIVDIEGGRIEHHGLIASQGGQVRLDSGEAGSTVVYGTIDVFQGQWGSPVGTVHVLGATISLVSGARIDAGGVGGGGTVLIGGDYQGKNSSVRNALQTHVGRGVLISADADATGDGGKVVVWADDQTYFYGRISARGAGQGGDGGFVEVSGRQSLVYRGIADLTADDGQMGTLLLDPATLTIAGGTGDGAADGTGTFEGVGTATDGLIAFADATPVTVFESEIETQSATANIILEATQTITTSGDFTDDAVTLAPGSNLTLRTRNQAGDGAGTINLTASLDGANLLFRTQGTGTITIEGSTDGGAASNITLGRLQSGTGAINVSTGNGTVTLNGSVTTAADVLVSSSGALAINAPINAGAADVRLVANGNVTQSAAGTITADELGVRQQSAAAGNIVLDDNNDVNQLAAFNAFLAGTITFRDIDVLTIESVTAAASFTATDGVTTNGGDVTIISGDTLTISQPITAPGAVVSLTSGGAIVDGNAVGSDITALSSALRAATGIGSGDALETAVTNLAFSNTTAGDVAVTNTGGLTIALVDGLATSNNAGGNITIRAASPLTVNVAVLDSGGGNITLAAEGATAADDLAINANVTATGGNGAINLFAGDSIQVAAAVTISAAGAGAVLASGGTDFNGGAPVNGTNAGNLVMVSGSTIQSEDGSITLRAPGDVQLSVVNANSDADGTLGNVTATADFDGVGAGLSNGAGAITDTNAGGNNITAASLVASAATGIDLDTTVTNITATSTAGNIDIDETDGANVLNVAATTGNADVSTAAGNLNVTTVTAGGTATLTATTGAITDANGDGVNNVTATSLVATAATGIELDTTVANITATSTAGNIDIDETDGANVLNVAATTGNADVSTATGNLNVTTVSAGGTATLTATSGAIMDANGDGVNNITATSLVATAATGIELDTTVTNITATSTAGNIDIDETNGATVLNVAATTGNADVSTATGNLNVTTVSAGGTATLTATTGAITDANGDGVNNINATSLVATAATGITLDTTVTNITATSAAGNIDIDETDGANVLNVAATTGNADVSTATGNLNVTTMSAGGTATLTATTGAILDANLAAINVTATSLVATAATGITLDTTVTNITATSAGGNIDIDESDGANVLNVAATTGNADVSTATGDLNVSTMSAGGTATLTATTGAITDANGDGVNNITAASLVATAAGNITLDTTVTNIAATSAAGNIDIDETNGANVLNVAATTGNADVSTATGDLNVTTMSAGGTATLTATTGAITDANAGATNVTATSLMATASTGIDLDTAVVNITANNTGAGNIDIDESDGANVLNVVAAAGNADVSTAAGDLNVSNVSASGNAVLSAAAGAITDANAGTNNVTATNLTLLANTSIGAIANFGLANVGPESSGAGDGLEITLGSATGLNVTANTIHVIQTGALTINPGTINIVGTGQAILQSTLALNAGAVNSIDLTGNDNLALLSGSTLTIPAAGFNAGTGDLRMVGTADVVANGGGNLIFASDDLFFHSGGAGGNATLATTINSLTAQLDANNLTVNETNAITLNTVTTLAGDIAVTTGAAGNIDVGLVTAAAGTQDATLNAAGAVNALVDDGITDVLGATINLNAAAGGIGTTATLDVTATAALNAGTTADNSNILIDSIGNLPVGLVNAGAGNVALDSTGNINSVAANAVADVMGSTLDLIAAAGGIGTGGAHLDVTAATALNANTVADNSSMFIDSIGNLPVGAVNAGAGDVTFDSTLAINNSSAPNGVANLMGATLNLTALGGGIGTGMTLELTATTALNADTTTTSSNIVIDSIGNLPVGLANAGTGNVTFDSTGNIVDDTPGMDLLTDIAGSNLQLTATTGVGAAGNSIDTNVANFEGTGGTGGLVLMDQNALVIGGVSGLGGASAAGEVDIRTMAGNLNVMEPVSSTGQSVRVQGAADLQLNATVTANTNVMGIGGNNVNSMQPVSSTAGDVTLDAGNDLTIGANVNATGTGGEILVKAGRDDFAALTLQPGALLIASGGQVSSATFVFAGARFTVLDNSQSITFPPLTQSQNVATITVIVDDPFGTNFEITVDWMEQNADPLGDRFNTQTINGNTATNFQHRYLANPQPNPADDILITVHITQLGTVFASGTIQPMIGGRQLVAPLLADGSNSADVIGISVNLLIDVTGEILPSVITLPTAEALPRAPEPPPTVAANFEFVSQPPQRGSTAPFETTAAFVIQGEERYYELRIVSFDKDGNLIEDPKARIKLDNPQLKAIAPFDPSKLPALFGRLPADRYRIYLVEDEAERLILDFIIQQGQPIEVPEGIEGGMGEGPFDPFDDDQGERRQFEESVPAELGGENLGWAPPSDSDRNGGDRSSYNLSMRTRQSARFEAAESFAEEFGRASFLSHGGVVVGAAALAATTSGRWEKSMDRVMEQFGRRRPFSRRRRKVAQQINGARAPRA